MAIRPLLSAGSTLGAGKRHLHIRCNFESFVKTAEIGISGLS
jgi:hypothetical protein